MMHKTARLWGGEARLACRLAHLGGGSDMGDLFLLSPSKTLSAKP